MLISVYCLTYNHEKYIASALEGFVTQKTKFDYEVFVHDDASTDGTADIIRDYAVRYPEIIKPIIQTENQLSKGVPILFKYIFPNMTGKYIAICEGDDFWCDENKLQKQVDFMERHPEFSACVHNTRRINCRTKEESLFNPSSVDKDITVEEIIGMRGGLFHLSSVLYRKEYAYRPKEFYAKSFGDYPLAIYLGVSGKVRYINEVMSTYRLWTEGSWTSRHYITRDAEKNIVAVKKEKIDLLNRVDSYTKGVYHNIIAITIRYEQFEMEGALGNYSAQMVEYRDVYRSLSIKKQAIIMIKRYIPFAKYLLKWLELQLK